MGPCQVSGERAEDGEVAMGGGRRDALRAGGTSIMSMQLGPRLFVNVT